MGRTYMPNPDATFSLWVENLLAQLAAYTVQLSIPPADMTALTDAQAAWNTAYADARSMRGATRSATQAKEAARDALERAIRPVVRRAQAHANMTDAIRAQLGITVPAPLPAPGTGGVAPALTPLVRLDFGQRGRMVVHFGPNPGNARRNGLPAGVGGAVVQVHAGGVPADEAAWQFLPSVTSSPLVHTPDLPPGGGPVVLAYRVAYTTRRGLRGPWSAPVAGSVTP